MIGYILTDFIEMAASKFGHKTMDTMVKKSNFQNQGHFDPHGWYDQKDLNLMIEILAKETFSTINEIKKTFGSFLFHKSKVQFGEEFNSIEGTVFLIELFENKMNEATAAFHPNCTSPKIIKKRIKPQSIEVFYESDGQMCHILDGFISESTEYFKEIVMVDSCGIYHFDKKSIIYSFQKAA